MTFFTVCVARSAAETVDTANLVASALADLKEKKQFRIYTSFF